MRYRRGDTVVTKTDISGHNVPDVPAGTGGTVVATTAFGKPKRVHFELQTGFGLKRFDVDVDHGQVR
jgi:hypothetical protein